MENITIYRVDQAVLFIQHHCFSEQVTHYNLVQSVGLKDTVFLSKSYPTK